MFRFTHISDTHGMLPIVPASSLMIIHSGDMAPNLTRGIREEEEVFQAEWWEHNLPQILERIGERYFVFIPGNHDYYDPEALLRKHGVKAHNITGKNVRLLDKEFYGFPYIPFIVGEWNYETRTAEMSALVEAIPECDILVAHCPPFGTCADVEEGKGGGNTVLANWFAYGLPHRPPQYILCGHFHESRGLAVWDGRDYPTIVSNAATVQHTFEVQ
jgi:Icc-related predicted phosphoesterase